MTHPEKKLRPRTSRCEEVKATIINAIIGGDIKPGERLPSLRKLCAHCGVALATVQLAVKELKAEEWVVSAPCKGIMAADPLPPIAHLMRLRHARSQKAPAHTGRHDMPVPGQRVSKLTCLIHDEALLPAFDWAAREYAEACAPYELRFETQTLRGRDDAESVRRLDADLVLLPSYSVARAARAGSITPTDLKPIRSSGRLAGVPAEVVRLVSQGEAIFGVPLMIGGMILAVELDLCRRYGIDVSRLTDMPALLEALESAAADGRPSPDNRRLFNIAFPRTLLGAAGFRFPSIAETPAMLADPAVRAMLERLRQLAGRPAVEVNRFDQWERADFAALAVRHIPSSLYCRERRYRENTRVLPIPPAGAVMTAFCMCVSARSVHPFEAWEWALHLAEAPFQARLAELAYDVPVNQCPKVRGALAGIMGKANAAALQQVTGHPSGMYGMEPGEDLMLYSWEVIGNEVHRFVAGINDYEQMLERLRTKTDRYLQKYA